MMGFPLVSLQTKEAGGSLNKTMPNRLVFSFFKSKAGRNRLSFGRSQGKGKAKEENGWEKKSDKSRPGEVAVL